jgi:AraC-like DNA-binding protein
MLRVPLRLPPAIDHLGLNLHGRVRTERYRMRELWGMHFYRYHGSFSWAGQRHAFAPGDLSVTPPAADLEWHFPRTAPHYYALMRFGAQGDGDRVDMPVVQRVGDRLAVQALTDEFEAAIAAFASEPMRVNAWMWNLLWRLAQRPAPPSAPSPSPARSPRAEERHPVVQTALVVIEQELDRPLSLAGLAMRTGVSPNHLIRLFRAHCGETPMAYLRGRRLRAARHLLERTAQPMRTVAAHIGMPDLQRFNKLVRRGLGAPPTTIRRHAGRDHP